jgi:hypothetical protein
MLLCPENSVVKQVVVAEGMLLVTSLRLLFLPAGKITGRTNMATPKNTQCNGDNGDNGDEDDDDGAENHEIFAMMNCHLAGAGAAGKGADWRGAGAVVEIPIASIDISRGFVASAAKHLLVGVCGYVCVVCVCVCVYVCVCECVIICVYVVCVIVCVIIWVLMWVLMLVLCVRV